MTFSLEDLVIERVDFVDEGCNSASFIELYKRKEQSVMSIEEILEKMKPEHAEVINTAISKAAKDLAQVQEDLNVVIKERDDAKAELDQANADLTDTKAELESLKTEKSAFDETETLKSMPQAARDLFEQMKLQKEAAEAEILKAKEEKETAEAISKAKELKAIPIEQDKLVSIIKSASADIMDLLSVVNAAIEGTVLTEVGKNNTSGGKASDAWASIEAKADEIAKADTSISKAKAISMVVKENPDLYRQYLEGGTN